MPKYVIERELPGAGSLSAEELQGIAAKSNHVIGELGPEIRWLTSYVKEQRAALNQTVVAPDLDPDNAATVAAGAPVLFPQNGPTEGGVVRLNLGEFVLPRAGTYSVDFSVSVTEPGQLAIAIDAGGGMVEALYGIWAGDRYKSDRRRRTHHNHRRELEGRAS